VVDLAGGGSPLWCVDFGVSTYLFSILLGLATIILVLRFQTVRIRTIVSST
jgi:hypothetical protein